MMGYHVGQTDPTLDYRADAIGGEVGSKDAVKTGDRLVGIGHNGTLVRNNTLTVVLELNHKDVAVVGWVGRRTLAHQCDGAVNARFVLNRLVTKGMILDYRGV